MTWISALVTQTSLLWYSNSLYITDPDFSVVNICIRCLQTLQYCQYLSELFSANFMDMTSATNRNGLLAMYMPHRRRRMPFSAIRCNLLKLDSLPTQSCRRPGGLSVDLIVRHGVIANTRRAVGAGHGLSRRHDELLRVDDVWLKSAVLIVVSLRNENRKHMVTGHAPIKILVWNNCHSFHNEAVWQ